MEIADLVAQYGFPTIMVVGLGYFVYFVWNFIGEHLDPATEKMHFQLIRVIHLFYICWAFNPKNSMLLRNNWNIF